MKGITAAKGDKKVSALASAIRTMQFMQRYETELKQRDDKLRVSQPGYCSPREGWPKHCCSALNTSTVLNSSLFIMSIWPVVIRSSRTAGGSRRWA